MLRSRIPQLSATQARSGAARTWRSLRCLVAACAHSGDPVCGRHINADAVRWNGPWCERTARGRQSTRDTAVTILGHRSTLPERLCVCDCNANGWTSPLAASSASSSTRKTRVMPGCGVCAHMSDVAPLSARLREQGRSQRSVSCASLPTSPSSTTRLATIASSFSPTSLPLMRCTSARTSSALAITMIRASPLTQPRCAVHISHCLLASTASSASAKTQEKVKLGSACSSLSDRSARAASSTGSTSPFTSHPTALKRQRGDMSKNATVVEGLNSEATVKRDRHPVWYPPTNAGADRTGLHVMNSLTEALEPFAPREGRFVRWYTCGPTVYDLSHMGHARAYLTFDILRRIMEDYFGYAVIYQMNITDIDDKIIKRARINTLLDAFKRETVNGDGYAALDAFTKEAVAAAEAGLASRRAKLAEPIPDGANSRAKADREEKLLELQLKETQLAETKAKIAAAAATKDLEQLFDAASSVNGELLDERKGHEITGQGIFEDHARTYERAFFEDMQRLGIREPDVVSRVTEYVPQVVTFVQKIIDNGFAYVGESSVFFDTTAYTKAGHDYPKLKPTSDGADAQTVATEDEMIEGEGGLSKARTGEKRSPNDFALWKFSKPGEPHWPSPWGEGRPGWHIECSVMASDILGENMDIHSGGWDLKFPHHDNECAQSEACNSHHQWVNYFLHCGHLHIKGLKMSKSLKNFITIRQALDELGVTPRLMRLLFLANSWHKPMNFSDQSLDEAKERERVLRAFFGSVDAVLRDDCWSKTQGANSNDRQLMERLASTEQAVHEALQNNFDTPTALTQLLSLVTFTNQYLLAPERPSATLLRKVARYITRMLQIFGVVDGTDVVGLQGGADAAAGGAGESRLVTVVDALTRFRDDVRETAKENKMAAAFLPLCDYVRDEALIDAGIRLEDNPAGPTTWKNDDPQILRRELEERREQQATQRRSKLENGIDKKKKLIDKWEKLSEAPAGYFKRQDDERPAGEKKFAAFDAETGMPTILASGEDVQEKELKKLRKELDKYVKSYEEYVSKGGDDWLKSERAELQSMEEELSQLHHK